MNEMQKWQPIYQELAQVIGKEATLRLYRTYSGNQITFPKRLVSAKYEAQQIVEEYEHGDDVPILAKRHHYSVRTIYRILAIQKE